MGHKEPAGRCRRCLREMRWNDEPLGRVIRQHEGMCTSCCRRMKNDGLKLRATFNDDSVPVERPDTTHRDRDWMDQYVARRRREGVPYNGIEFPGEEKRQGDMWVRPE